MMANRNQSCIHLHSPLQGMHIEPGLRICSKELPWPWKAIGIRSNAEGLSKSLPLPLSSHSAVGDILVW